MCIRDSVSPIAQLRWQTLPAPRSAQVTTASPVAGAAGHSVASTHVPPQMPPSGVSMQVSVGAQASSNGMVSQSPYGGGGGTTTSQTHQSLPGKQTIPSGHVAPPEQSSKQSPFMSPVTSVHSGTAVPVSGTAHSVASSQPVEHQPRDGFITLSERHTPFSHAPSKLMQSP